MEHQINEEIRDKEVRLISDNGEQLGILPIQQAQNIAVEKGMDLVKVRAVDDTGVLDVTFFNQPWLKNQLHVGETYIFYGKAEGSLLRKNMVGPIVEPEAENIYAPAGGEPVIIKVKEGAF